MGPIQKTMNLLILLTAPILVCVMLILLILNFRQGQYPFFYNLVTIDPTLNSYKCQASLNKRANSNEEPYATLSLTALTFSSSTRILQGAMMLRMPNELKKKLFGFRPDYSLKAVFVKDSVDPTKLVLDREYEDAALSIHIAALLRPIIEGKIPLKNITPSQETSFPWITDDHADAIVDIPLEGRPNLYPDDWYAADSIIYTFPPTNTLVLLPEGRFTVPIELCVLPGPGLSGTTLLVEQDPEPYQQNFKSLKVLIMRDNQVRIFTYIVSCLPIFMALLFAHLLFLYPKPSEYPLLEVVIGAATIMIAVLPLRAVLVPPEIRELTRVDLILGFGLVLIVCVAFLKYSRQIKTFEHSSRRSEK